MGLFEHFPYTNYHNLNLDWIISKIKALASQVDKLQSDVDQIESGGTVVEVKSGEHPAADAATISRIYEVMRTYLEHQSDLVYMHKAGVNTPGEHDGSFYGYSALYDVPTYGYCGANGSRYTDDSGTERQGMAINCTTFAILSMLGIPYDFTTYNNQIAHTLDHVGKAGYSFNPWMDFITSGNLDEYYNTLRLFQRFKELGLGYEISPDFSNIHAGDILWSTNDSTEEGIYHCGICMAVAPIDHSQNDPNKSDFLICEVINAPYPVKFRWRSVNTMLQEGWKFGGRPQYGIVQPSRAECLYTNNAGNTTLTISGLPVINGEILTYDFDYTPASLTDYIDSQVNGAYARTPNRLQYITTPVTPAEVGKTVHYTIPVPISSNSGKETSSDQLINSIGLVVHNATAQNNQVIKNLKIYRGMPADMTEKDNVLFISSQADYESKVLALIAGTNRTAGYDIPIVIAPTSTITIGGVSWAIAQYTGVIHVQNSASAKRCIVDIYGYSNNLKSKYTGSSWTHTATTN